MTSGQLTCSIGSVAPGATVVIRVDGAFVRSGSISNTATVTATNDGNSANNSDDVAVTVLGKTCTIVGTFGDDIPLLGTNGADVICGLSGNDQINARLGNDTVYGNEGNDRIMGLGGNDLIDGGPGVDTTTYSAALQSVRVDLSLHKATGQGTDTFVSIENILGSKFRDTLIGNALKNYITGGAGGDVLSGLGGADVLAGGAGADTLRGGGGNDTLLGGTGGDTCLQGTGTGRKASC